MSITPRRAKLSRRSRSASATTTRRRSRRCSSALLGRRPASHRGAGANDPDVRRPRLGRSPCPMFALIPQVLDGIGQVGEFQYTIAATTRFSPEARNCCASCPRSAMRPCLNVQMT